MQHIKWIPLLIPISGVLTIVGTIASSCYIRFDCTQKYPTLSYAATFRPEYYVFAIGMCITALFILLTGLLLGMHTKQTLKQDLQYHKFLTYAIPSFGTTTWLFLSILAIYDMAEYHQVHVIATIIFFVQAWLLIVTSHCGRIELSKMKKTPAISSADEFSFNLGRLCLQMGILFTVAFGVLFLFANEIIPNPLGFTAPQEAAAELMAILCQLFFMEFCSLSNSNSANESAGDRETELSFSPGSKENGSIKARQSMGVMPQRGAARRMSHASQASSRPPRQSLQPGTMTNTARRSSTFGSRTMRADPRPVSDKAFMNSCIRALIQFLSERQYDHALSMKLLTRPSKKDFSNIVCFLFRLLDPNFIFSPKFEDDVSLVFRHFKYPFPISKTALVAVGSPHTWPPLLACVSWLVELLSYDEEVQQALDAEGFEDESIDKTFFDYLGLSYKSFLLGDDDHCDELQKLFTDRIDSRNEKIESDIQAIQEANNMLKTRIEEARNSKSSLPDLQARKNDYNCDIATFKDLLPKMQLHNEKLSNKQVNLEDSIQKKDTEIESLKQKLNVLCSKIKTQELSAADVERMSADRVKIEDQISQGEQRKDELKRIVANKESEASIRMQQVEETIAMYNDKALEMKLLPKKAKYAKGVNYELEIDVDASKANHIAVLTTDLKHYIKPALIELKNDKIKETNVALDNNLDLQVQLDNQREATEATSENKRLVQAKSKKLEDTIRRERELKDQQMGSLARQTEDIEMKIQQQMDTGCNLELKEQLRKIDDLKSEVTNLRKIQNEELQQLKKELEQLLSESIDHKDATKQLICSFHQDVVSGLTMKL